MCYGVRPDEMSFANHSRMCLSFYESIACVKGGGDAFIRAFERKFKEYDVDIRCNATIAELADIHDSKVGRFVLSTGEEIVADNCVFTIHPKEIVKILPQKHFSKAFMNRVSSFESSAGFFSVFASLKGSADPYPAGTIVSLFPDADVNKLLDPQYERDSCSGHHQVAGPARRQYRQGDLHPRTLISRTGLRMERFPQREAAPGIS